MDKPALEIRVDAIGGAGIRRVALQMVQFSLATGFVVICEFQPGVILQAKPDSSTYDVIRQLPGHDDDDALTQTYAERAVEPPRREDERPERPSDWRRIRARTMDRFEQHVEYIGAEINNIRTLFQSWGGH